MVQLPLTRRSWAASNRCIAEIMQITAIKTDKITPGSHTLYQVLDQALPHIDEGSIVAITSKIVAICEGSIVPKKDVDKEALIISESDLYMPKHVSAFGFNFTIRNNTLIASAGIDESNSQDAYVLWPKDAQATANELRAYLTKKHGLKQLGIIITDSTHRPLRRGSNGISLAHSGFAALHDYVGQPDIFGRPLTVSVASIDGGLAAAAVVVMGEGDEQTPLALIANAKVEFQDRDPSPEELDRLSISIDEDMFAPFLKQAEWKEGGHRKRAR